MSLTNIIQKISKGWLEYRDHCKSTSKTGYGIRVVKKDHYMFDLVKTEWTELISKNVDAKVHYPIPIHLQKAAMFLKYKVGESDEFATVSIKY